ncbi:uncharacterized protein LOC124411020 [Diprion similis]|uniref:uncharacterized protein LOC124411020 n=1 Tax=Diprion similis TaxID=362088 RepID=UPI001EF7D288|nr:uncharacterized protein LOC124411020 [Diprion similis]
MSPPLCRGCAKQLTGENAGVDVFDGEASSSLRGNNLRTGIELITGIAVSHTDGLPRRLCAECNDKLEAFLAFRTQLLTSLRLFLSSRDGRASTGSDQLSEMSLPAVPVPVINQEGIGLSHVRENTYVTLESNSFVRYSSSQTEHYVKVKRANVAERDEESEIDVCSGDDDEVLELDFQSRKDEIYEIDSSEESDVQVCDYEPSRL